VDEVHLLPHIVFEVQPSLTHLRELCQLIGLKIVCCDYDLNEPSKLPFESSHIAQIEPVVKCIEVQSEDERLNLDLGYKFFHENKIQESLECYLTAAQIIMNVFDVRDIVALRDGAP
jgi:hypothetical protein